MSYTPTMSTNSTNVYTEKTQEQFKQEDKVGVSKIIKFIMFLVFFTLLFSFLFYISYYSSYYFSTTSGTDEVFSWAKGIGWGLLFAILLTIVLFIISLF